MNYSTGFEKITSCVCPGHPVVYECTVMGGPWTLWTGTAFNNDCREILLLHDRFQIGENYKKSCNNGDILGRSLGAFDNFYISQLSMKVRLSSVGKTVECAAAQDDNAIIIGSSTIQPTTGILSDIKVFNTVHL